MAGPSLATMSLALTLALACTVLAATEPQTSTAAGAVEATAGACSPQAVSPSISTHVGNVLVKSGDDVTVKLACRDQEISLKVRACVGRRAYAQRGVQGTPCMCSQHAQGKRCVPRAPIRGSVNRAMCHVHALSVSRSAARRSRGHGTLSDTRGRSSGVGTSTCVAHLCASLCVFFSECQTTAQCRLV